jgi:hypothetical protein
VVLARRPRHLGDQQVAAADVAEAGRPAQRGQRDRRRLDPHQDTERSQAPRASPSRMTSTGKLAVCASRSATLPSSQRLRRSRPSAPTISRLAGVSAANSASLSTAKPGTAIGSTSTPAASRSRDAWARTWARTGS